MPKKRTNHVVKAARTLKNSVVAAARRGLRKVGRICDNVRCAALKIARRAQRFLDFGVMRWTKDRSLVEIARGLRLVWVTLLAAGIINYVLRYKLEFEKYFPTSNSFTEPSYIFVFLGAKWAVVTLGLVFLITLIFLNLDNGKYVEQAEGCFLRMRAPTEWRLVRGRYIVIWVVTSNIFLFLGAVYSIDDVKIFSILFMLHHLNAVAWIIVFRWNVNHYFHAPEYLPTPSDPSTPFVLERREVMETFLCRTANIQREGLTAMCYAASFLLALIVDARNAAVGVVPYLLAAFGEAANQYFSYRERRDRNAGLRRVYRQEREFFDPDRKHTHHGRR